MLLPFIDYFAPRCITPESFGSRKDPLALAKVTEYAPLGIPVIVARTRATSAYFDDEMVQVFLADDLEELRRDMLLLYKGNVWEDV